jgi:type IV pilus assembly protein PilW
VINASVNNEAVGNTATSGWSTSGGASIVSVAAMPGTDMIRVWYSDPSTEGTLTSITYTNANTVVLRVSSNMNVAAGDILMLSDCDQADWVHVCTVTPVGSPATAYDLGLSSTCATTPVYTSGRLMLTAAGARVQKVVGTVFYIGKRSDTATNLPSLFRRSLSSTGIAGTAEELVEGVENMQILYGENTNNDSNNTADRFVPADNVTDWDAVVSVRITLLVMSLEDNLVSVAQPYTYNGVVYNGGTGNGAAPPDKRLRRVFTTTINLRNVTLGG